ncbi:hypothetical protein HPB48_000504 [Haemaphysalis longicornis]|uniref:Uncharacterized protein n=1 Tax=Haemaphysalis longicornis TaxID=44386 RepID=A0A9J6FT64_HAELO|nr:hypothetical protein HPB48_000504 [Haemaphysalis longicornis]
MAGRRILRKPSIRVIGAYIEQDGKSTTCVKKVTTQCKPLLHLIRRVTSTNCCTRQKKTRQLLATIIYSRILNAYNYHVLSRWQQEQLKKIDREAIRIVTGLPKYSPLSKLYAHGGMNFLSELAEQALSAQRDRLSSTNSGLFNLYEIGILPTTAVGLPCSPPPLAVSIPLMDGKPVPRGMGRIPRNSARRRRFAKAHNYSVMNKSPVTHTIVYTGMAVTTVPPRNDNSEEDEGGLVHVCAVAWVDTTHCVANADLLTSTGSADTTHIDLLAPLHATQWVRNTFKPGDIPQKILFFTDSARAYICRRVSGASSSYPGISGVLVALFLDLHSYLNITASIPWYPPFGY